MQETPLVLPTIFRRAERLFGSKSLVTASPDGAQRTTYADWAARTRKLGGALDQLGISPNGRVGTFSWNSTSHLELYFAAPCTGRVLHTLNIRLFPEQLTYIVNHAEDEVVFVDRSLIGLLWPLVDSFETVKHYVVSEADTILPVVPMFHANAWGLCQAGVMAGSTIVFPGRDLSPQAIADLMEHEHVTLAAGVPTIWMGVLPLLDGRDLSHLKRIVCGGSAVPRALSEGFRQKNGMPILQAWGMTETSPIASECRIT